MKGCGDGLHMHAPPSLVLECFPRGLIREVSGHNTGRSSVGALSIRRCLVEECDRSKAYEVVLGRRVVVVVVVGGCC